MNLDKFPNNEFNPNRAAAENVPEHLQFEPEGAAEEMAAEIVTELLEQSPQYRALETNKKVGMLKRYTEMFAGMTQNKLPQEDIEEAVSESMNREGFQFDGHTQEAK